MQQRTVRVAAVVGIAVALAVGGVALGLAVSNQADDGVGLGVVRQLGDRS